MYWCAFLLYGSLGVVTFARCKFSIWYCASVKNQWTRDIGIFWFKLLAYLISKSYFDVNKKFFIQMQITNTVFNLLVFGKNDVSMLCDLVLFFLTKRHLSVGHTSYENNVMNKGINNIQKLQCWQKNVYCMRNWKRISPGRIRYVVSHFKSFFSLKVNKHDNSIKWSGKMILWKPG